MEHDEYQERCDREDVRERFIDQTEKTPQFDPPEPAATVATGSASEVRI